jgi:hypothetical protein
MRIGPFHLAILVGTALLLLPATTQAADGLFTPPEPEGLVFLDAHGDAATSTGVPVLSPTRYRGLETGGERRLRHEGGLDDGDIRSGRGRSLALSAVLGNRHPTAFDRYVDELENRIRSARRKLDR